MENDTSTVTISTSEYENLKFRKAELEALVKYYEEQLRLSKPYGAICKEICRKIT